MFPLTVAFIVCLMVDGTRSETGGVPSTSQPGRLAYTTQYLQPSASAVEGERSSIPHEREEGKAHTSTVYYGHGETLTSPTLHEGRSEHPSSELETPVYLEQPGRSAIGSSPGRTDATTATVLAASEPSVTMDNAVFSSRAKTQSDLMTSFSPTATEESTEHLVKKATPIPTERSAPLPTVDPSSPAQTNPASPVQTNPSSPVQTNPASTAPPPNVSAVLPTLLPTDHSGLLSAGPPSSAVLPTDQPVVSSAVNSLSSEQSALVRTEISPAAVQTTPSSAEQSTLADKYINFTGRFMAECMKKKDVASLELEEGDIYLENQMSKENRSTSELAYGNDECTLYLSVPLGMVFQIDILLMDSDADCSRFSVEIMQYQGYTSSILYRSCRFTPAWLGTVYTFTNTIRFRASRFTDPPSYTAHVRLLAIPEDARPQLHVQMESAERGYITTPLWDGRTFYPVAMDSQVTVEVPEKHVLMFSFLHLHMPGRMPHLCHDRLWLYAGGTTYYHRIAELCGRDLPPPQLVNTHVFHARFSVSFTQSLGVYTGFKLLFSFHSYSAAPQQMENGQWNCSVPHFPHFRSHFPCDLSPDCLNGEDEGDCPYSNPSCGQGQISVDGTCYEHVTPEGALSWDEASAECVSRGGRLASLNTPAEWQGVLKLLGLHMVDFEVFVGLRSVSQAASASSHLYRHAWQWADKTVAYYADLGGTVNFDTPICFSARSYGLTALLCDQPYSYPYLCEFGSFEEKLSLTGSTVTLASLTRSDLRLSTPAQLIECPAGHVTHASFACDVQSSCWTYDTSGSCQVPLTPVPPSLTCSNGVQRVPYSLVCDHVADCSDHSDEDFCVFPACGGPDVFQCDDNQCVPQDQRCDGLEDCANAVDEVCQPSDPVHVSLDTPPPPAIVNFLGGGNISVTGIIISNGTTTSRCPATHFECAGDSYCLPVFVRCNGMYDCPGPGHEDEMACDRYKCRGYYRCRSSVVCLHPAHVCDGMPQCPQRDDEMFCRDACPPGCTCYGLAFYCSAKMEAYRFADLRFLDGRGSGLSASDVSNNTMLVSLSLARCALTSLDGLRLPNLRVLDLADNYLRSVSVDTLSSFPNLQVLSLAGNPLVVPLFPDGQMQSSVPVDFGHGRLQLPAVHTLDLSRVPLTDFNVTHVGVFPDLRHLNLSGCGTERVVGSGFSLLAELRVLDLRDCPMSDFPRHLLQGLDKLNTLFADNYKLCCSAILPSGFNPLSCHAPTDEISSCDALLRSDIYRVFLAVFAALTLLGNAGSFVTRACVNTGSTGAGFGVFVSHLSVSDLLMGLYLAMIGVADRLYLGTYLWQDTAWKSSAACQVAGFLCLLSSEVSAFIICLITLDRFLVLRLPFSPLHFHRTSAHVASALAWTAGLVLAAVPLLPVTSHWQFYGQNGICIPLPITRASFPGHAYSFGVMIVLNFVLFVLIAAGQLTVYWAIRSSSMAASDTTRRSRDLTIARRLITIAMTDFFCWFPVGLLGLLASNGLPVPGEVNVAMAIFVLPLNSALNPFLYTVNRLLERRQRAKEEKLKKQLEIQLKSKYTVSSVADRMTSS